MAALPIPVEPRGSSPDMSGVAFDALDWPMPAPCPPAPLACAAWADAVAAYWSHLLDTGALDPRQPLVLLDLAPGDGTLARGLLERLTAQPQLAPLLYVVCAPTTDACDGLLGHPALWRFTSAGLLDALAVGPCDAFLADGARARRLRSGRRLPARARNPVTILAWDYFAALPSELHGVHHGAVMETAVTRVPRPGQPDLLLYASAPRPTPAPAAHEHRQATLRDALLAHYVQRCNSNSLLLPLAAVAAIERISIWSGGRYLLLGADDGVCDERQLRLNACSPPQEWPAPCPVPLNVHALMLAQRRSGAATWCRQLDDCGRVVHAACRDGLAPPASANATALGEVAAALLRAHPDDSLALEAMAAAWNPDQALALAPTALRLCGHDPALLHACLPALLNADAGVENACEGYALEAWHAALEQTWRQYHPPLHGGDFHARLAALAVRFGHWGLARECLQAGLSWYGEDIDDLCWLAHCEGATGRHADAAAALARALALDAGDARCLALQSQLALADPGPAWRTAGADAELVLEPLRARHAAALVRQYRDPQIAVMTSLPALEDEQQACDWIAAENADPDKLNCAIMHACRGLVGMVSLQRRENAAYFYFWVGCDFQGMGYGPRAAALLWPHAARLDISTVYTSAFADNARSCRALELAGFRPLAVDALAPDDDLVFMARPLGRSPPSVTQLRALCDAIDSPLRFNTDSSTDERDHRANSCHL